MNQVSIDKASLLKLKNQNHKRKYLKAGIFQIQLKQ